MAVNSSSNDSSNNSMDCLFIKPNPLIFYIFNITNILLFLPIFVFVLYLGFQRWWQQRSSSSSAVMSHTDSFTYHLTSIELIGVLGFNIICCAVYLKQDSVLKLGYFLRSFTCYGQTFFHMLTCVERYLAVAHPVTYLGLRRERGVRIRTVILALSVLCILIRPGPGDQGGDRERVDQSKQRAFYTILAILGVLLFRCALCLAWALFTILEKTDDCLLTAVKNWLNVPSSLVLPLLFLIRAGKLTCCKNNTQGR
ncbi:hypothetical protein EYF80_058297 [Liparis tanakae]|uniref:Uncharacterized protein n=1 Tax=Liparis tanakae TaxID=230148 RepID=A0A4Z2ESH8_9TELE|nr:hypothetical protein EYF80_058297 [Liparis tanakae]